MKSYCLQNGKYLGISYFRDVKNIKWLKDNMFPIFKDKSPVLISSRLIIDPFQIVVAVNNSYLSCENSCMKTKSLANEILFNLSSSKNITQSLKEISANDQDDDMIVVIISKFSNVPEMQIFQEKCITGCETDISEIAENIDENYIKSYYKISQIESENSSLLDSIVTRIACKALTL
ncbi:PREDICTED: EKC/KEOPS complex subunit TPRKB-like [Diuraphis noxia]|uniref:EKC/KEOPS complex subunit TPRKB-like n=1 Tax=Diuraphis noxia TaxID=143948 RepID=UPI000763B744|nr:PREDICTED: EKC/KEOPS complex subunit TPRKB-like [Diuraphis noxia]